MEEDLVDGYDTRKKQQQQVAQPQGQPAAAADEDDGALEAPGPGAPPDWMREQVMKPHKDAADVYAQFLKRISVESPEDKAAREKREASRRKWAAISDGIRAISNLWFTSQYAPHGYDSSRSWGTVLDGKLKDAAAERERNNELYLRYALGKAQAEAAGNDAVIKYDKMVADRDRLAVLAGHKARKAENEAAAAEHKARRAKFIADGTPDQINLQNEKTRSEIGKNNASAAQSYARADKDNVYHTFMGKKYRKGSKDYDKVVIEAAKAYNKKHEGEAGFVPIKIDDEFEGNRGKVIRRVPRKPEEFAGEVERRLKEDEQKSGQWSNTSRIKW